jgi:hypothetical protein
MYTPTYTSQLNDVAKRKSHTLHNMAKIMLKENSLPKCFWDEAISCKAYLFNKYPTEV